MPADMPTTSQADKMPPGEDDVRARASEMAMEIPEAERPIPAASVKSVVDAFNEAADATFNAVARATGQPPVDPMQVPPGESFERFPAEVYVPAAMLLQDARESVPGGEKKYACDPRRLATVAGARELAAKLSMLAEDKKVKAAIAASVEQAKAREPAPEGPSEADAEMLASATSRPPPPPPAEAPGA